MSNNSSLLLAKQILKISENYEFYSNIIITLIGLISNLFIILILINLKIFRKNQCSFYLIIECLSNICLLLIIFLSQLLTYILHKDPIHLSVIWCKLYSWLIQVFCLISLLTICCTTFDQYLSTNYRYSFKKLSSLKLAYYLTLFNICFSIFYNIPLLILSNISSLLICSISNLIFKKYLSYFYYPILINFLSIIITISFSLLAYKNVRKIIRRQTSIIRKKLDRQLTSMILARVICLEIFSLPYIIYSVILLNISINENDYLNLSIYHLIKVIILSLFYTNYSINFYIYLFISSRFRHQFKYFLFKKFFHKKIRPINDQHVISIINLK